jgi:hypothetical protein
MGRYYLSSILLLFFVKLILTDEPKTEEIHTSFETEIPIPALEKDKLMTCAEIITKRWQEDGKVIDELTNQFGAEKERITIKIQSDMLSQCFNKIEDSVARGVTLYI